METIRSFLQEYELALAIFLIIAVIIGVLVDIPKKRISVGINRELSKKFANGIAWCLKEDGTYDKLFFIVDKPNLFIKPSARTIREVVKQFAELNFKVEYIEIIHMGIARTYVPSSSVPIYCPSMLR